MQHKQEKRQWCALSVLCVIPLRTFIDSHTLVKGMMGWGCRASNGLCRATAHHARLRDQKPCFPLRRNSHSWCSSCTNTAFLLLAMRGLKCANICLLETSPPCQMGGVVARREKGERVRRAMESRERWDQASTASPPTF